MREELYRQAKAMHYWRTSPDRITSLPQMLYKSGITLNKVQQAVGKGKYFDPAMVMRSLDAAGDERTVAPEVYAPVFRYLRSSELYTRTTQPNITAYRARPPKISYHVGESFSHLMTGLRRIDETIRFMGLESGDRLGHALALGINPEAWLKRSGEFTIPKEEALDNFVWLWHCAVELSVSYPELASSWVRHYKKHALKFGYEIYGNEIKIEDLHFAWKLRRNCPMTLFKNEDSLSYKMTNISPLIPDAGKISNCGSALELFRRYHFDKEVRDKGKAPSHYRFIEHFSQIYGKGIIYVAPEELKFWEAVQDYMMYKIADIGIIIESNPSSNVYIADFTAVEDHPIFRFYPPDSKKLENGGKYNKYGIRNGALRVCVNTDDPSMFNTSLINEFRLLENTAKQIYKMSDEEIYPWIERLKKIGLEVFESTHINPWFTM